MNGSRLWLNRLRQLAGLMAALALVAIWLLVAFEQQQIRETREAALGQRAESMARLYGEVVRGQLRELDTAMLLLREQVAGGDMAGLARMVALLRRGPLAEQAVQVAVIGADGMLRYSNLGQPAKAVNLADRPHFRVHLEQGEDRLYIGAPVLGRVSQQWTVQVSRRIQDARGRFAGVLVLSVPPRGLAQVGKELELGPDHVLTLLKPDLTVVSRYPQVDAYLGTRLPETVRPYVAPPFRAHLRPSTLDHKERMIAYVPLPELELLAGVSLSLEGSRAAIAAESRYWWYLGGSLSLLVLVSLTGFLRYVGQKERSERQLRQERERLETTLALARFGSWEYDLTNGRSQWSASAYEVFGFPAAAPPPDLEGFLACVHPDDRARVRHGLARCQDEGEPFEVEFRILAPASQGEKILFVRGYRAQESEGPPLRLTGVVVDVSDSRRLAESLRQAEKRWQWAVTASRDGVWDVHARAHTAWYSPRWRAMLGYGPEELPDTWGAWLQLLHPDDRGRVEASQKAFLAGELPYFEAEFRLRTRDGGWRWILSRGQAVEWDEQGLPCRFMGTHTDISERKATELALARERQRLAEAQAVAQMGSWEWNVVSGELWWSSETYRIFGLRQGELEPSYETFLGRIHPEDRERVQAALSSSLEQRTPYLVEHRVLRPDGSERIVQERGVLQWDEAGKPQSMLGTTQDITARKRGEEAMAESEARYRSLVTAMAEGVVVQDARGRITFCNDAACDQLGLSREQMLGLESVDPRWQTVRENGEPLPGNEHPAMLALHSGQAVDRMVMGVRRADGERVWLTVNARPLLVEGERVPHGVVTTFADITGAKVAQLNSQLAEAVVNCTTQPIVVTDGEGFIIQANPAFCILCGYEMQEIVGRPVGGVMNSGHQKPDFYAGLWQRLRQEGNWEGEVWNRRRTGEVVPQWLSITAIRSQGGQVERYVGIYMDITEHKRREESMWRAANYDPLTGLPNRLLFQDRLQSGLARARRLGTRLGVLFLDLDHFKAINDSHGHRAGDLVLQGVARRMAACVREDDTLARIAGDEFMGLLQNLQSPEQVEAIAAKLLEAAEGPVDLGGGEMVRVSCSIGYAVFPDDDPDGGALVELADQAMYRVKEGGRRGVARHRNSGEEQQ